jgi:hypothetical protein
MPGDDNTNGALAAAQAKALCYAAVAQASAMAVQDGARFLGNVLAVSGAGIAVCTAKLIATKDLTYKMIIDQLNDSIQKAATTFSSVGEASSKVLGQFQP